MSALNILESLLSAGKSAMNQAESSVKNATSGDKPLLTDGDKTTLSAGVLGMLVGHKANSNLATYGGLAALGTVAYRAYQRWQANQSDRQPEMQASAPATATAQPQPPTPINQLPAAQAEEQSKAILSALIAAAKADGHIEANEQAMLDQFFSKMSTPEEQAWLKAELAKPVDPVAVASLATDPHLASQMYAVSVSIIDSTNFMEKAYLDELAKQLDLTPELKNELETQVAKA
ncbi:tellurite resistance TerB family protein [Advenella mimigardefordensis]|uniref:Putative membrane protein n=1 Tax=Advenella mimigardefordensis (strain DSM 17166 / LMG 22922 / DPN7) TaxID=1247726 RepID=W0P970_ADVMD|nr:tellurite resistance TerB family protein [Advenella mimigardefordensis]AHG63399.1 putative membrane protein [Advenella mimigardefordensis DPN7]